MPRKIKPENILAIASPELAAEWVYKLNGEKTPNNVSKWSKDRFYWNCPNCGHPYPAKVHNRYYNKSGCPVCNGKVVTKENCLANDNPELSKEWDYENNDCTPEQVFKSSSTDYYWVCPLCNKSYPASPANRNKQNGTKCPRCFGTTAYPETSFAAKHPDLLKEWDFDKNAVDPAKIKSKYDKNVFWICPNGHDSYPCRVADRTNPKKRSGCPECSKQYKTSYPEQALFYYLSKVFEDAVNRYRLSVDGKEYEIDIFINSLNLGIEYDGYLYHLDKKENDEWKNKVLQNKVKLVRVREEGLPTLNPFGSLVLERKNRENRLAIKPSLVAIGKILLELFELAPEQKNQIQQWDNVDIGIDEQKIYESFLENTRKDCLDTRPDLLEEWDYKKNTLNPSKVPLTFRYNVFWICKTCGHEWDTSVVHRVRDGSGCDKCANLKRAESNKKTYAKKKKQYIEEYDLNSPLVRYLKELLGKGKIHRELADELNLKGFRTEGDCKEFTKSSVGYYIKKIKYIEQEKLKL